MSDLIDEDQSGFITVGRLKITFDIHQHPFKPRHQPLQLMTLCQRLTASILAHMHINTSCRFPRLLVTACRETFDLEKNPKVPFPNK